MGVTALRYFNVYGPQQSPDSQYAAVISLFTRQLLDRGEATIYGDGEQSRDFIYVDDVVRANLLAVESPQAPGGVFNVCSGRKTTILELFNLLREVIPADSQPAFGAPRPGDIYHSLGDPSLSARTLGFEARTDIADGLQHTVDWMRQ
jgi:UDP-glucose 4-epimerase